MWWQGGHERGESTADGGGEWQRHEGGQACAHHMTRTTLPYEFSLSLYFTSLGSAMPELSTIPRHMLHIFAVHVKLYPCLLRPAIDGYDSGG